jgi:hypothetical protein
MTIYAGGLADASDLTPGIGIGIPDYVVKPASETVTASTTLQDDDDLLYSLAASSTYEVEVFLIVSNSTAGDVKTAFSIPSGATGSRLCVGPTDTAAAFTSRTQTQMRLTAHGWATSVAYQIDTSNVVIVERGIIVTSSAGTLKLQWAQNASSGTGTKVETNSYLKITRVS